MAEYDDDPTQWGEPTSGPGLPEWMPAHAPSDGGPHYRGQPSQPTARVLHSPGSTQVRVELPTAAAPLQDPAPIEHHPRYKVGATRSVVKDPTKGLPGWWRRVQTKLGRRIELPREQLQQQIRKELPGPRVVAVCNHSGGSGKTTTTAAIGQELATHRRDRVIAIDAAVAVGGLSQRLPRDNKSTIRTLLRNLPSVDRWTAARQHTSQGRTGLELLASGDSIADEDVLTSAEYRSVIARLTANDTYNLVLVDCDAGVIGELKDEVLRSADVIVIPVAGTDGVAGGVTTANRLRYLADKEPERAEHFIGLLSNAIVVHNHLTPRSVIKDAGVVAHFVDKIKVRHVHSIPFDPLLQDGQEVDVSAMNPRTEYGYLAVATEVVLALQAER